MEKNQLSSQFFDNVREQAKSYALRSELTWTLEGEG